LAGITVGDGLDVAVVGALNVSPESFYGGSVVRNEDELVRVAVAMAKAGAAWIDVGAMSTAPYLGAVIPEAEEADRLRRAIARLTSEIDLPLSADTSRLLPAQAALEAGARAINDVTGLSGDSRVASLVARAGVGVIVMASERGERRPGRPMDVVSALLTESLAIARDAGIELSRVLVDPGIGFFRNQTLPWYEWDCEVLARLSDLHRLGRPVCVGVSRKSFIGAVAGEADPAARLPGSLAATAVAVLHGTHVVRTHDVAETSQAVKLAQAIRKRREAR